MLNPHVPNARWIMTIAPFVMAVGVIIVTFDVLIALARKKHAKKNTFADD